MTLRQYFRVSRKLGLTARSEAILIILLVTAAAFEGVGIGMLLPIVGYIQNAGDVSILAQESGLWRRLIQAFEYFGIPITLGTLIATSFVSILLRQCFFYARQIYSIRLRESLTRNACNLGFLRYLEADTAYHDREASGGVVNSLTTELRLAIDAILAPIGSSRRGESNGTILAPWFVDGDIIGSTIAPLELMNRFINRFTY